MFLRKTAFLCLLGALAACSPKIDTRGYVSYADFKEHVKIGQTGKDELLDAFGSPSSQSSFGDETWYYVSTRKETTAFLKPEIVKQDVVRIVFDASGKVAAVESADEADSRQFDLVKRTTPTEGHQLNFFEQIVGNIGRFNKAGADGPAPGRRSRR